MSRKTYSFVMIKGRQAILVAACGLSLFAGGLAIASGAYESQLMEFKAAELVD